MRRLAVFLVGVVYLVLVVALALRVRSAGLLAGLPLVLLFGVAAGIVRGWLAQRELIRRRAGLPHTLEWADSPVPDEPEWRAVDEEARGLGYQHAGVLLRAEPASLTHVYIHQALPIYLLTAPDGLPEDSSDRLIQLESFFDDGARITTTTSAAYALTASAARLGVPRLVQLREEGTVTALDGQHVGTVKAWMAGGREALPARHETLLAYLAQDRQQLAAALEHAGWLPFGTYLEWLVRRPHGVLRF